MASRRCPTTMENLSDEVLSEIFVRLLPKQLARMRCVCKSWKALLFESSFVKFHLHHLIHNNDDILLFFGTRRPFDCGLLIARPSCSPDLELANIDKFPVNPQSLNNRVHVIGSVNGLICFSYVSYDYKYVVGIWNPSLSTMLTLPPCPVPSEVFRKIHLRFGFGFDPKTDDYKLVKLTNHSQPPRRIWQGEVYSMRKGSWELISQPFPSNVTLISNKTKVCVDGQDGHLHWLCYTPFTHRVRKPQMIVAFNLDAETFLEMPLPDAILGYARRYNVLGVLAGKLCVISRPRARDGECEMWVMDEYGVPESWVKHHVFSQLQLGGYIVPYGITLHNEILCKVDDRFALYDPVKAKTKTFKIMDPYHRIRITKVVEYVKSLVWVAPART